MKKMMIITALFFSLAGFAGCQKTETKASQETSVSQTTEQKATIKLQEDGKEISKKTVAFKDGATLYEVIAKNFAIEGKDGFITKIEGHSQDERAKKYWTFKINNKEIMKGAKEIKVKENDQIVFNLAQMQ
ncbi:DUF4430 domain-containing protein [Enterococcus xiangfangensis]|uniref:DUF4430 domain-containing protein n=1 Tax=Enterococcus xiangfangensis TaxID=1296537 RepID=UPI0010F75264|nr:DUF4430 domain-containing protein [Enterococcus xiangfangensis]MBM7711522.1 lipopolysaccharide export LptBFGC system permease protein LptF [Enterococcus xiangfangensis]